MKTNYQPPCIITPEILNRVAKISEAKITAILEDTVAVLEGGAAS